MLWIPLLALFEGEETTTGKLGFIGSSAPLTGSRCAGVLALVPERQGIALLSMARFCLQPLGILDNSRRRGLRFLLRAHGPAALPAGTQ